MKNILIALFPILISCSNSNNSLIIIPQWHLEPHVNTNITNFDSSKYKQKINQNDIYQYLSEKIESDEIQTVIAEGCEGEITQKFNQAYNGWDYNSLYSKKHSPEFDEILTSVALKLKVKYPRLNVICGDNRSLIQKTYQSLDVLIFYQVTYFQMIRLSRVK